MQSKAVLGKRIREERLRQEKTLKDVEGVSGVSATHISQIERGITWPTVNALGKVASALNRNTSFFLEEVELPETCVAGGSGPVLLSEAPRVTMKSLTNGIPGRKIHFYTLTAEPSDGAAGFVPGHKHEGDECGWVLSGCLQVRVGEEVYELKRGDSIHFNGSKMHGIRNVGSEVSESIWAALSMGF
jgi:mannose-6-phosphate isomerase-like protein (cupin superfamily)